MIADRLNGVIRAARSIAAATLTPLLEKNVTKTIGHDAPVIFSMSRVIVLCFAVAMLRQIWKAGVAGWPDATLCMAIVLALPTLGALERVKPGEVLDLMHGIVSRLGVGPVRPSGTVYAEQPSKFDDHRSD